jgi:hypothetical protein
MQIRASKATVAERRECGGLEKLEEPLTAGSTI